MDTSLDAINAGSNILNRYVTARNKDRSFGSDKSNVSASNESGYFEAVVDGSHLSALASASKKGLQNRSNLLNISASGLFGTPDEKSPGLFYHTARKPKLSDHDPDYNEGNALELVRVVISKLMSLRGEGEGALAAIGTTDDVHVTENYNNVQEETVEEALVMLQGVEEHLEGVGAIGFDLLSKQNHMNDIMLNGNELSPVGKENSMPGTPGSFLSNGMATPLVKSAGKHNDNNLTTSVVGTPQEDLLKVYMNNQLELNQDEMREYESMISKLTEQIEEYKIQLENSEKKTIEQDNIHQNQQKALQQQVAQLVEELTRKSDDFNDVTTRARESQDAMDVMRTKLDEVTAQLVDSEAALKLSETALHVSNERLVATMNKRTNPSLMAAMASIVNDDSQIHAQMNSPVTTALENALEATEVEQAQFEDFCNKLMGQIQEKNDSIKALENVQVNLRSELSTAENLLKEAEAELENVQEDLDTVREKLLTAETNSDEYESKMIEQEKALHEAQSNVESLQELVNSLKEKDAMNEEMITELNEINEESDEQMANLQIQLQETASRASNAEDEAKAYKKHLATAQNQADEDSVHRRGLAETIDNLKQQLNHMNGDLNTNVSVLTERIEQLQLEKEAVIIDKTNIERSMKEIQDELYSAQSKMNEQQQALEEAQDEAQYEIEQREMLWKELQDVIRSAPTNLPLSPTTQSRHSVHEGSDDEKESQDHNESYRLNNPFVDPIPPQQYNDDDDNLSKASESVVMEEEDVEVSKADYHALAQRLADAEQRATEASEKGAGQMATNLRATAVLDAECTRLRALGEHFKAAHASLVEEHKAAREQAVKVRGLERNIHALQSQIQEQESAHTAALKKQQTVNEDAFNRFEQEREQLHELRGSAQASSDEHERRAKIAAEELSKARHAREQAESDAIASARRVEELQAELDVRQKESEQRAEEYASLTSSLEQAQAENQQQERSLLVWKQEKENVHLDWHAKHSDLQEDFAAMEGELAESTAQLSAQRKLVEELEEQLQVHRQQLLVTQGELQTTKTHAYEAQQAKEEAAAALQAAEVELAKRYASIQKISDAADEWQSRFEDGELALNREKERAKLADIASKTATDEIVTITEQLSTKEKEVLAATEATQSAEARLNVLKAELERIQNEDMVALETARKKQQDIQHQLTSQLELERQSKMNAEEQARQLQEAVNVARTAEQAQTALVSSMQQRTEQLQNDLREARETIASNATADVDMGLELHNVIAQINAAVEKSDLSGIIETNDELLQVVRDAQREQSDEDDAEVSVHEASNHSIVQPRDDALPSVREQVTILQSSMRQGLSHLVGAVAAANVLQQQNETQSISTEALNVQVHAFQGLRDSQAARIGELEHQNNNLIDQVENIRAELNRNAASQSASGRRAHAVLLELHNVLQDTASHALRTAGASISTATADSALAATAAAATATEKQTNNDKNSGVHASQWEAVLLEAERATSALSAALEEASVSLAGREQVIAAQRKELEQQQQALNESAAAAQSALSDSQNQSYNNNQSYSQEFSGHTPTDVSRLAYEHAQLRVLVGELGRGKEALEAEGRTTININSDLRSSLLEAERLCENLKARNRTLQTENDALSAMQDTRMSDSHSNDSDNAVELERAQSELLRIRADNEVLLKLQQSLEAELERSRSNRNSGGQKTSDKDGDVKTMDCERILGALYSTVDQLISTGLSGTNDSDAPATEQAARLHELQVIALSQAGANTMTDRLDSAVQYLSELRIWAREEQRSKHSLVARMEAALRESNGLRTLADDASKVTEQLRQHRERDESDTRALRRELSETRRALAVAEEEQRRSSTESSKLRRSAADERARVGRLSAEEQARAAEITRLRHEAESHRQRAAKAVAQVTTSKDALEAAQSKVARLQRENSDLLAKVNSVPSANSGPMTTAPSNSSAETGGNAGMSALQERIDELKSSLSAAKDELRSQREARSRSEANMTANEQEIRTLKRKVELADGRCDALTNEKYILHDEKGRAQAKLAELQQQLVLEQSKRQRAEVLAESVTTATSTPPVLPEAVAANAGQIENLRLRLEETDNLRKAADEERSLLRTQLAQLRGEHERQHANSLQSMTAQHMVEAETSKLRAKAERLQRELGNMKDEATSSRAETRRLRRIVLEASSQVREATNVMRAEAAQTGALISSPEPRPQSPGRNGENGDGSDALGLSELRSSLAALREGLVWLRHGPQQRTAILEEKRAIEAKLRALETEYEDFRVRGEQEISQARAEVKTQQARAETARTALRQARAAESELRNKIQDGDSDVNDRANHAEAEIGRLRARLEQMEQHNNFSQHQSISNSHNEGPALHTAMQELRAVEHHRGVLRGMVERLESQLKLTADSATQAFEGVLEGINKDQESSIKQAAKYRARASALEHVVQLYRTGIMALYPDGNAYSAAHYDALVISSNNKNDNSSGNNMGWLELEITAIRHSYEAELRLADNECVELRGKLRQADAFSAELTRRFEESVQMQYGRGLRSNNGEDTQQFMERTISSQAAEISEIRKTLSDEKDRCRRRHAQTYRGCTK
jgi:DNA repair exonuclease SbcCD ATPase subunit